jgi:uncharacterized membrane protein
MPRVDNQRPSIALGPRSPRTPQIRSITEARIHKVFESSILLKGAHAIVECIAGAALALISTSSIFAIVTRITAVEIAKDPRDFVATHLMAWASGLSMDTKGFFAWYLLSHGIIKLGLVVALLRNKPWAYPASLGVLGLFVLYQVYRYTYAPSAGLIVLTIFDLFVLLLIWHEYRLVRKLHGAADNP